MGKTEVKTTVALKFFRKRPCQIIPIFYHLSIDRKNFVACNKTRLSSNRACFHPADRIGIERSRDPANRKYAQHQHKRKEDIDERAHRQAEKSRKEMSTRIGVRAFKCIKINIIGKIPARTLWLGTWKREIVVRVKKCAQFCVARNRFVAIRRRGRFGCFDSIFLCLCVLITRSVFFDAFWGDSRDLVLSVFRHFHTHKRCPIDQGIQHRFCNIQRNIKRLTYVFYAHRALFVRKEQALLERSFYSILHATNFGVSAEHNRGHANFGAPILQAK